MHRDYFGRNYQIWCIKTSCILIIIEDISIKNHTYYFFDDIISIKNFDPNNIKIDEKLYENILIYYTGYVTIKDSKYVKMKMNMINCILLVLLLFVSMVLLKCTIFPLVIHLLNVSQFLHLQVLLITIFPVFFAILCHSQYLMITLAKTLFLLFLKLRMQIFPENFWFPTVQLVFLLIFHFKKPLIQQKISFPIIILI